VQVRLIESLVLGCSNPQLEGNGNYHLYIIYVAHDLGTGAAFMEMRAVVGEPEGTSDSRLSVLPSSGFCVGEP